MQSVRLFIFHRLLSIEKLNPAEAILVSIDRTVVNVDAMIYNAGSDAMGVLERSPGILLGTGNSYSL